MMRGQKNRAGTKNIDNCHKKNIASTRITRIVNNELLQNGNIYVSVIIPCFNAEEFIEECIESILIQKVDGVEIIIIDDASHIWSHQILCLEYLYDILPSGGIYIIEDLETSFCHEFYDVSYADSKVSAYNFLSLICERVCSGRPLSEISKISSRASKIADMTESIMFFRGACLLVKRCFF